MLNKLEPTSTMVNNCTSIKMKNVINKKEMLMKSFLFIVMVVVVTTSCKNRLGKNASEDLPDYIAYADKYRFLAEEDTMYFAFTRGLPSKRDVVLVVRVFHNPEFNEDEIYPHRKPEVKVETCEDCLSLVKEEDYIAEGKQMYVYGTVREYGEEKTRTFFYFKHWGFGSDQEWRSRSGLRRIIASGDGYTFHAHHSYRNYGITR